MFYLGNIPNIFIKEISLQITIMFNYNISQIWEVLFKEHVVSRKIVTTHTEGWVDDTVSPSCHNKNLQYMH